MPVKKYISVEKVLESRLDSPVYFFKVERKTNYHNSPDELLRKTCFQLLMKMENHDHKNGLRFRQKAPKALQIISWIKL